MLSVLIGIAGFIFSCWYMFANPSTQFHGFYDKPALVLLTVAPIAVIFISHNFFDFLSGIKSLFSMAMFNQAKQMNEIVNQLSHLNAAIRTEGMGKLVGYKEQIKNPLFKDGVTLILSSFTNEEIKHNITAKINNKQVQLAHAANLFESLGKLSPGMGLMGTIIGLMHMLSNLSDPAKIGGAMAASLLATFYGLIYGNVIYVPIADKINIYAEKILQLETMIMEGLLLLKDKKSGAHLRDVVNTYSRSGGNKAVGESAPGSMRPAAGRGNPQ